MEFGWIVDLLLLLIASVPSIILVAIISWHDRVRERRRWRRRQVSMEFNDGGVISRF